MVATVPTTCLVACTSKNQNCTIGFKQLKNHIGHVWLKTTQKDNTFLSGKSLLSLTLYPTKSAVVHSEGGARQQSCYSRDRR